MSLEDRERYSREREKIRARQKIAREIHGEKWDASRKEKYRADPMRQMKEIWRQVKHRCFSPACKTYEYYGGRGITMCDRWRESFEAFVADVGIRPDGLQMDRINNEGNYEPGNIRWATRSEQMKNRRPLPVTCSCGICKKCKHREYYREYRLKKVV